MSQNDLQVVNDNWNRLSASAQNEFRATISGMNSSSRAQLENAINNASSATASANGAAGNTTTTTIGGAVYNMGRPVEAARVGLKPDIRSDAKMSRIVTDCDGDFTVAKEEGEDGQVQATTSTWFGLGSSTRPNGAVYKIVPTAPPTVSKWELIGVDEQQRPIYEQVTRGFQAIITEYIVGADAQSGLNVNGEKLAAATGAAAGAQSYGNHIKKIACSVTKHRIMYPVPVKPVDVCPNIEGVQTTIPPGMKKDDDGQCIVPPAQPPAAAAPALDQDKAPFMTGERRYLGPITPRETDSCPFTKPDGKVIRVKKQPGQICASEPITRPAVTDARLKDGKK
ncbi:MAG: hypothetical protein E6R05_01465 [Candidatus Moraniibacteriota bacterium]|nr:MAG: hypothetical protein E6R05_01465 [Candidatus Moranbacteria bacterium]